MKKLFLSVVLLLTVSFAFAANDVEKDSAFDVEKTTEVTNSVELTTFLDIETACLFEFSWDTDEHGQGSLWVDCGVTDDGPFDWGAFLDTIMNNFF